MSETSSGIRREYPRAIKLRDGGEVSLRLMTPDDVDRIVALGRELPEDDLMFLRVDITDPAVVQRWVGKPSANRTVTLIAEMPEGMAGYGNLIPPAWAALAGQAEITLSPLNTVSTNVPGPQIPLYLAGHKLLQWYPLGPLATTIGLFNAILSYNQVLTIGATVDPALMPDVWRYMDFLRESYEELRGAAERASPPRETAGAMPRS